MKKRGNISMLVMFVLLACSLLGLLTVHFLKNMFTQYGQILSYYKTYYLAKAGIETALTQLQHRGLGFSESVSSLDSLVRDNIKEPQSSFSFSIVGKSNFLSTSLLDSGSCKSPFTLLSGQSLIIPLFIDNFTGTVLQSIKTPLRNQNLGTSLAFLSFVKQNLLNWPVNLGLLIASADGMYQNWIYFTGGGLNWDNSFFKRFSNSASSALGALEDIVLSARQTQNTLSPYLIIANRDFTPLSFCLELPQSSSLPTQQYLIQSLWYFWSTKLWLDATYRQPIPSFLINSSLEF